MTKFFSRVRASRPLGWFKAFSIQTKLSIIITIGFVVTFAVLAQVQIANGQKISKSVETEHDTVSVEMVAAQLGAPMRFRDKARIEAIYGVLIRDENAVQQIRVVHADGALISDFAGPGADMAAYGDALDRAIANIQEGGTISSAYVGLSLVTAVPVLAADGETRLGTLAFVNDHTESIAKLARETWKALLIGAAVAFVGLAFIGFMIRAIVARPFNAFSMAMEAISNRDFEARIPGRDRKDEIGKMAANLEMFRNVLSREQEEQQKREQEVAARQRLYSRLSGALADLAAGNLDREIDLEDFSDMAAEHTEICRNFNAVLADLRAMLSTVTATAETVRGRSVEISDVARDQAKRSEAQAATLEESAAAIEELNTSVQRTASLAADAAEQIRQNRVQAEAGGDVVERTTEAMKKIEDSSQQITAIIGVIDDIAFQTNLLALNAGVEAARAGDAGRGFAVVASEVRALAQRASESANEIKGLILNSSEHVAEGSELADQAGAALKDIIQGVSHVSEVVSHIATGSREQAENLGEIKDGIDDLDRVTQQNAAVIEETSAASSALNQDAEDMARALGVFKFTPLEPQTPRNKDTTPDATAAGTWQAEALEADQATSSGAPGPAPSEITVEDAQTQASPAARTGTGGAYTMSDQDGWDEF